MPGILLGNSLQVIGMTNKRVKPSKTYFGSFPKRFVVDVHQLLAWGYQDAHSRIRSATTDKEKEETAITGFIAEAIEDRIDDLNRPKWCKDYSVYDDPFERHDGRSGRSRLRSDLRIKSNMTGGPKFIFEAKRLRTPGFSAGKYVGTGGMGCFISGLYASRYDEAGMIGYVQSNDLAHWQEMVKEKIGLIPPQQDVQVVDAFPLEWMSYHQRKSVGRDISIYHILLDCRYIRTHKTT